MARWPAVRLSAVTVIVAMTVVPAAFGQAEPSGQQLYQWYCASCHGVQGRGDGPDAAVFAVRPRDLREGFLKKYKTEDLVHRVRDGRPLELALDLPALRARAAEVEEVVAYLKRLPAMDWSRVESGQRSFINRCALCHGWYGRPGPSLPAGVRAPRDLSDPAYQRSVSDKDLITAVRHGRQGMPALTPQVSRRDARLLAAYVRELSPGFQLYAQYCASCHGDRGRGAPNLAEAIQRPTVVFDRRYFQGRDPEQLRAAIWHMVGDAKPAMPHYRAVLTASQARAIVEYLKHTE